MLHLTDVSEWLVTITDGSVIRVWADSYQVLDGHYDFGVLVDTGGHPPARSRITARTPGDADRVVMSVARFPTAAVADVKSG